MRISKWFAIIATVFGFTWGVTYVNAPTNAEAKMSFKQYRYYVHRNKIKLTKNVYVNRFHVVTPMYKSRVDAVSYLKKGTILKVGYSGTNVWRWVIVDNHKFPQTKHHLWSVDKGETTNWFKVLHHYKSYLYR